MSLDLGPEEGVLAFKAYVCVRSDGSRATMVVTLGDPEADSVTGRFARKHNALVCGIVVIMNAADAPHHPMIWLANSTHLLVASDHDRPMTDEWRAFVERHLRLFIIQHEHDEALFDPMANANHILH